MKKQLLIALNLIIFSAFCLATGRDGNKGDEPRAVYDTEGNYVGCEVPLVLVNRFTHFRRDVKETDCQKIGARVEGNVTLPECWYFFENWFLDPTQIPTCLKKKGKNMEATSDGN